MISNISYSLVKKQSDMNILRVFESRVKRSEEVVSRLSHYTGKQLCLRESHFVNIDKLKTKTQGYYNLRRKGNTLNKLNEHKVK